MSPLPVGRGELWAVGGMAEGLTEIRTESTVEADVCRS